MSKIDNLTKFTINKFNVLAHIQLIYQGNNQNLNLPMNESDTHSNSIFSKRQNGQNSRSYLSYSHGLHQSPHSQQKNQNTPHRIGNNTSNLYTTENTGMIYGTNISARQAYTNLETFITEFQVTNQVDGQMISEKIYYTQLCGVDLYQANVFMVQGKHIKEFDRELYHQFIYFPAEMISIFDQTIKSLYDRYFIANEEDPEVLQNKIQKKNKLMIGIKALDGSTSLRQISHKQVNRLVSVKGIVIRCSEIYPEMTSALFRCCNCSNEVYVVLENARIQEPKFCDRCKLKETLQIIHNSCAFTDKQFIKFQQLPQFVPEGETPCSISLIAYDSNVDNLRPGDRVDIVGIYRVGESKVAKGRSIVRSVYNTYLDMISSGRIQEKTLKILDEYLTEILYNDDDKNVFTQMADSPTIINDLVKSFAPSIFGHEEVKKGLLTQLFGGCKKDFSQLGRGRFRSDINICLVGDPSTAKSQLLQQVHKISPRGIYTSGRGSSAVGLTANVRKDPETKEFVLESGALVLSDLGICCIDQFDKMDPQSRLILLEAMEQQTISIAKAGIVCQLNSRAAILCAANPVNSRYNDKKSVVQNINLPPALLSRFDLIYILLDQPSQGFDRMLATHILNLYSQFSQKLTLSDSLYTMETLSKYITYAKQYIHPIMDQKAGDRLVEAYSEMRKLGNNKKIITATTRQLQSLIRISEAFAKMRLSNLVEQKDVEQAIAIVKFATQQAATDPITGLIDMDVLVTGKTSSSRRKVNKIKEIAFEIIKANVSKYKKNSTIEGLRQDIDRKLDIGEKATDEQVLEALKILETEGIIVLFGPSKMRPNFRLGKDLHNF